METKIGKTKNYDMFYDPKLRRFILRNDTGEQVASGETQEQLEKQADVLAKQKFSFPIKAIRYNGPHFITEGRVTSLNISEKSVWFVEGKGEGGYTPRGKRYLGWHSADLFELTDHNVEITRQIREHQATVKSLEEKIGALAEGFEKPIDLKYFGLQE